MENRLTREAALARIAEIEREISRLEAEPAEEQRRIAMATAAARAGGGGMIAPPNQPPDFTSKELVPAALRYGVPLAVGMATGPVGGLAALARTAAITGGAAGAGEAGAQTIEEGEYRPREIVGATVRGATPVFKGSAALAKTVGGSGLAGLLGGATEGKVTGVGSGAKEFAYGALPAGLLQGGGALLGANRQRLTGGIIRSQDIERIAPGQIQATFGQAFPEFAGLEARVASQTGSQELNQQLIDQARVITRAIQTRPDLAGIPAEAHSDLVSRV